MAWKPSKTKCGVAICNWHLGVKQALDLSVGETVHILEEFNNKDDVAVWFHGKSLRKKEKMGIFPACCIKTKAFTLENEGQYETVTPSQNSTVKEVGYVLLEWSPLWRQLYLKGETKLFHSIGKVMSELVRLRRELVSHTITNDQVKYLKQKIITRIDWGNRNLGLEFVPRIDNEQVDPDATSVVKLYRIHAETSHNTEIIPEDARDSQEAVLKPAHTYHILFHMKGFVCNVGDDAEVYFSLYDAHLNCYISERFLASYTKKGAPVDINKLQDNRALFTSLGFSDLQKDLYIVAFIYRRGKMKMSESSKKAPSKTQYVYKRPYGLAVHSLKEFLQSSERDQETEFYMKVQSCTENESQFPQLLETLIKKQVQGNRYIASGSPNQTLVGSLLCLKGDLQEVKQQNPLLFNRTVPVANKLGFPDVIKPADARNNLYINIQSAELEKGEKSAARNVEVTMMVFDSEGKPIQECIIGGSGEPASTEYQSAVFYHCNKPEWNEIVDVSINIDQFAGSHIRFEFKHCSTRFRAEKKLFGFSFVNITTTEGVTLKDGIHSLCIYKCEDPKKLRSPSAYAKLISFYDELGENQRPSQSASQKKTFDLIKEKFTFTSTLCSTKFTQKADLLALLEWKNKPEKLPAILEMLQGLEGGDVVQFLQDILDALFDMFGSEVSGISQNSAHLFNALVHLLNLLKKPKFENFISVLDTYIKDTFCASSMYRDLIGCMKNTINQAMETSKANHLVKVFEVLDYLFKILVRSRQLARAQSLGGEDHFKEEIRDLFKVMESFVSLANDSLPKIQECLLQHLFSCYKVLTQVLSNSVVCEMFCNLLRACRDLWGNFLLAKVGLLRQCVNSDLFNITECRAMLLPLCKSQIKRCLIQKGGVSPCTELLSDILHSLSDLKEKGEVSIYKDVETLVLALFNVVMQTAEHFEHFEDGEQTIETRIVAPLVACIIEMLQLMEESHYTVVLQEYPKGKPKKQFLMRVLTTFHELIRANIFPKDWFVMKMVTNNVILTAVQYFAQALTDHFHEGLDFDYEIWSSYFNLAVAFITQPSLQLETFSEGKREKVKERYGDMRVLLGFQIQTLWQSLGNNKQYFIPALIGPFLEITMVPETELRKATLPIFYDMMECEHKRKGNFKDFENEMIRQLDHLITNNKGDVKYKELFKNILEDKLRGNMGLKQSGTDFIRSITNLLEQLLDYRQVLDGEENRDKRMHCTFNILNFYKADGNREEMYIRYIDKLHCLHVDAQNFVEAGFTLLLYADLLPADWDDEPLRAQLAYPPQRVWERKEALYKDIIEHFDKGKAWEYSIPLCKELCQLYEKKCYDYKKLSQILQKEATCFTNIMEGPSLRQAPSYYRIAYYGQSFPPFVRNKEFVYRGDECQRLGVLIHQLQTEFPSATIMSSNTTPEESIKEGDTQYIQICNVKPVPKDNPDFRLKSVPIEIQQFYKANEVDTFRLDIPFHRGERDKNNEFKTLCIERTLLQTAFTLPGILRSFEVVSTRKVSLTPIECAIESMNEVNMELRSLIDKCQMKSNEYFNQLEMRLNGVISAKVNGGIPMFQAAFFTAEFPQEHPEESKHLATLKATLVEQIQLLETGLKLHGMIAPSSLQPLHKSLEDAFRSLKKTVRESQQGSPFFSHSVHSSPASSRGNANSGSVQSLTSTPPGSNRSSTTSGDNAGDISLIRFEDDDPDQIYTEAYGPDYETPPNVAQNRQSISSSQSSMSSLSSASSSRPQSVGVEDSSLHTLRDISRSGNHGSDSNLLASRVTADAAQKGLPNSKSSESIRPRSKVPSPTLKREASEPNGHVAKDGDNPPPLPSRRPTTGSRASTLGSPQPSTNGSTAPSLPRVTRKTSGAQLPAVEENTASNGLTKTPAEGAPPIPMKQSKQSPPSPITRPSLPARRSPVTSRPPSLPPRRNSQRETSAENTQL